MKNQSSSLQTSRKALVTGASSGIGAVYADRFAKRGYDLILVARDLGRLDAVANRIRKEYGREVQVLSLDLSKRADVQKLTDQIGSDSEIEVVVNNAGYSSQEKFIDAEMKDVEAMIAVNITALTALSNAAAKSFAEKGRGTLINIGSGIAFLPDQFNAVYGGTKAFVLNFSRNIAEQLRPLGVTVQVVLPGAIKTEAWDRAGDAVASVPKEAVMSVDDLVDAALSGLDQKEVVTLPSLENLETWQSLEKARAEIVPQIFSGRPASRYTK